MSKYFLLILFCSFSNLVFTQVEENWIVKSIEFEGLKKTKAEFLLMMVQTKVGQKYVDSTFQRDIQQVQNVGSISAVSARKDSLDNNQIALHFLVEEVPTLLPIINFGGIRGNVWFQLGFSDINWGGKGQYLLGYYQFNDQRHSGQVYYRVPNIKQSPWGFSASVLKWASREPLFFPEGEVLFDYDNNSLGASLIRNIGLHRNLEFGTTVFVEKYKKSSNQSLENPPGPESLTQSKLLFKLQYQSDYLDYDLFYLKGLSWGINWQNVYNFYDQSWFYSLQFEGRQFFKIGEKGNLAMRLRLGISTNNDTPFAPFVVDSHVNLRGVGNRIDRGTAQAIFNIEYRHTLLSSNKWAIQTVAFSDAGTWRNPGGELIDLFDSNQFRQLVGGGIRIIYRKIYGTILRIDYGVDVFNTKQRGLVLGVGQYF